MILVERRCSVFPELQGEIEVQVEGYFFQKYMLEVLIGLDS
jgi:hypothetical protein